MGKMPPEKIKKRAKICLLLLSYLVVANAGYNFWTAPKNTPICKSLTTFAPYDLWTSRKNTVSKPGTIVGILCNEDNPSALIVSEIVHEGESIHGVKIVKIYKDKVQFEKKGKRWTQTLREQPNFAWPEIKADVR